MTSQVRQVRNWTEKHVQAALKWTSVVGLRMEWMLLEKMKAAPKHNIENILPKIKNMQKKKKLTALIYSYIHTKK